MDRKKSGPVSGSCSVLPEGDCIAAGIDEVVYSICNQGVVLYLFCLWYGHHQD